MRVCHDDGHEEARMMFHRNAKLGLTGRYALVSAIAGGVSIRRRRVRSTVPGDGVPLVASLD